MVVHSSQVEALEADAGHPVFDLLRPQLRRLLFLLDQPVEEVKEAQRKIQQQSCISYGHGFCGTELNKIYTPFFPGMHAVSITVSLILRGGLLEICLTNSANTYSLRLSN